MSILPIRPAYARSQIKIRDLYKTEIAFSDQALALEGEEIEVPGFISKVRLPDAAYARA